PEFSIVPAYPILRLKNQLIADRLGPESRGPFAVVRVNGVPSPSVILAFALTDESPPGGEVCRQAGRVVGPYDLRRGDCQGAVTLFALPERLFGALTFCNTPVDLQHRGGLLAFVIPLQRPAARHDHGLATTGYMGQFASPLPREWDKGF